MCFEAPDLIKHLHCESHKASIPPVFGPDCEDDHMMKDENIQLFKKRQLEVLESESRLDPVEVGSPVGGQFGELFSENTSI